MRPPPFPSPPAVEKYSTNNEAAARMIKENMDKKFGAPWHCVVGEYYRWGADRGRCPLGGGAV